MQLPHGYETVVGEQGLTLSAGNGSGSRWRALSDPEILLLDDATSSVDARIEEEIHATLRRIASTRTTLLIAHRRSTLSLADRIVVVDKGQVVDAGTNEELTARCQLYRMLLSGPGDDAEGIDAVDEEEIDDTRVDGVTPAAWRGLDDDELRSALIADRTRTASPAAMRFGAGPGGGGGGAGGAAWGGALAPTPELLAQVDALEPADADPHVDVAFESQPAPDFSFLGFLRRYRAWLFVGMFLVALDAVCTLAGPLLVRFGLDDGVRANAPRELWIATIAFLAITLFDWWVMWAEARVMGRISERLLHALRIKVFAHLQRLGVDYYENEMAGRIMTRMTTDIDALSTAAAERSRQRARQPRDVPRRRHRARVHQSPARADQRRDPAAAVRRHALVPPAVDQGLRDRARAHGRGQRQPPRGLSGCASRRPSSGRSATRTTSTRSRAATATRGCGRSGWSRSTFPSSTSSPTSRCASCSARAACSSRTARSRSAR